MPRNRVPHVLLFPFPAQGHANPMLKLAELLCLTGDLHVTFLNTTHYHHRLISFTDAQSRFASFPLFRFETIPDGLSDDNSRSVANLTDMFEGINNVMLPAFRELMVSDYLKSVERPPVTCIITDGLMPNPIMIAKELGIASIAFRTTSACNLWSSFHYRSLIESGKTPFQDADMDTLVKSIPGMETFLRCRDLPSFFRITHANHLLQQVAMSATILSTRASATLLNTFDDLEAPILSLISAHFPRIYTIGPLHALLTSRRSVSSSNSLWEIDRSCMTWLDSQPAKSVVYVSFGSVVLMSYGEMLEFWYGLVNSGRRFLWVIRRDSVIDRDEKQCEVSVELTQGTKERGYIVDWSPQEEVLVHPAVGGFVTHSGWNSTLESIIAGVPMICWPHVGDQQINSRFASEVWKIGLDMKDICDRSTLKDMVNDLMENKRDELTETMDRISELGKRSISKGGTSYCNLEALIEDIKFMRLEV